jgi:hypothetical protein
MSKEKVFIVLSHKNTLRKGSRTDWEVVETVEFVNNLKKRHVTMSSAIGDYLNRKIISGKKVGMEDYDYFETYVRKKYAKQMEELDSAYHDDVVKTEEGPELVTDTFGNVRPKTVFDNV